jgi:hypothetical protein
MSIRELISILLVPCIAVLIRLSVFFVKWLVIGVGLMSGALLVLWFRQ